MMYDLSEEEMDQVEKIQEMIFAIFHKHKTDPTCSAQALLNVFIGINETNKIPLEDFKMLMQGVVNWYEFLLAHPDQV